MMKEAKLKWCTAVAACSAVAVGAATAAAEDSRPRPEAREDDAASAGVCSTEIRLQGTVYQPRNPDRSMAMLESPKSARGGVYVRGMGIEQYRVVSIEPRGVLLESAAGLCWLRLKPDAAPQPAKPAPERRKRKSPRKAAFSSEELDRGVKKVSDTKYQIDPRLLEQAFGRIGQLARATSLRPVQRDGRPFGMRLRKLARGGLLERAGLQRGDVMRTLNGISLATPDGALRARSQLAEAKRLSLALIRDGKPITIEYGIR